MTTSNAVAEALKPLAEEVAANWRVQFGWLADTRDTTARFVLMRPVGGGPAVHVRRPIVSVVFVGAVGDRSDASMLVSEAFAERVRQGVTGLAFAEVSEPTVSQTDDGRPVAEVAVSSILSL